MPEVVDVFRVRLLVEVDAVAGSTPGHPAVERMRECVQRARTAASADDWRAVGTADVTFHEAVVALADSPILADLYRSLSAQLRLMFGLIGSPRYMHEQYIGRNARIVDLIQAGDTADAAAEMRAYLHDAQEQIVNAYVSGRVASA
nr:FCD domain-containing protein [Pseudoclavibacter sp. 13-3]